jgi:hypothetical protein
LTARKPVQKWSWLPRAWYQGIDLSSPAASYSSRTRPEVRGGVVLDSGIGVDVLAVEDVDVPAQLVVLGVVAGVAQGDAKVDRLLPCMALTVCTAASRTWCVYSMTPE